jgi:hypothetical protein
VSGSDAYSRLLPVRISAWASGADQVWPARPALCLYGPTGVGKTTLTAIGASIGLRTTDLERTARDRVAWIKQHADWLATHQLIGCAELNPLSWPVGFGPHEDGRLVHVLLSLTEPEYRARRELRDALVPGPARPAHSVRDWERALRDYDIAVDASGDPDAVLNRLLRLVRRLGGRNG